MTDPTIYISKKPSLGTRSSIVIIREAAERVLRVEKEIIRMGECPERDWFMSKPGHRESFVLARLALEILDCDDVPSVAARITAAANLLGE